MPHAALWRYGCVVHFWGDCMTRLHPPPRAATLGLEPQQLRLGKTCLLAGLLALALPAGAGAETTSKPMPWDECLAAKAEMQAELELEPRKVIDIVKSAELNVTRLCTDKGAVSISCSKADQTMLVTFRPQQSSLSCLWRSLVTTES